MGAPRYIQLSKYLTHRFILDVTAAGTFGDTVVSTAVTGMPGLYYQGRANRFTGQGNGHLELQLSHFLLMPSSVTAKVNDQVRAVVNQDGETVLASGRIASLEKFTGWRTDHGVLLVQAVIEFN